MKKGFKRILMIVLSFIAIVVTLRIIPACGNGVSPNNTPDTEPVTKSGPKYVAHRGYSQDHLGNTESAFRAAAEKSFYGIETDIRKTKDGYYVCNHDATVEYDDGTKKKISSFNRAELLDDPLKNIVSQEEAFLCTFETYLSVCKESNKVAVIELKDYFSKKDIADILAIVDAEYDRKKVSFISFIYVPLEHVKEADPTIPLQYLSQTEGESIFDNCIEDGISVSVKHTILTEELVEKFHNAGLTVNVWTVNDESILDTAYQFGVDYVTTDVFYEYPIY